MPIDEIHSLLSRKIEELYNHLIPKTNLLVDKRINLSYYTACIRNGRHRPYTKHFYNSSTGEGDLLTAFNDSLEKAKQHKDEAYLLLSTLLTTMDPFAQSKELTISDERWSFWVHARNLYENSTTEPGVLIPLGVKPTATNTTNIIMRMNTLSPDLVEIKRAFQLGNGPPLLRHLMVKYYREMITESVLLLLHLYHPDLQIRA